MAAVSITIRRATLADLEPAARLFDGYRRFYERGPNIDAARTFLHDRMSLSESAVFLAADGGHDVGFAQLYPSFSSVRLFRTWILNDLFVDPAARGRGVGRAMLSHIADFARTSGAKRLTLQTARDNHAAQALYRSMGWTTSDAFMEFTLDLVE